MARKLRPDFRGRWVHVYHRGVSRRTTFENRRDVRTFLAQVSKAVRRAEILVHAYAILTNHFHLLVSCPDGLLSKALQRILSVYTRYFNRTRGRSGQLFDGRYHAKLVDSKAYRRALIRYIDDNPVEARLVDQASEYPYGSAQLYALRAGPPWLDREWVEEEVQRAARRSFRPTDYERAFPSRLSATIREWIERRNRLGLHDRGDLDGLLAAAGTDLRAWWESRERVADDRTAGTCLAPIDVVTRALTELHALDPARLSHCPALGATSNWSLLRAGTMRDLCGLTQREIALRRGMSRPMVQRQLEEHRVALRSNPAYLRSAVLVAESVTAELRSLIDGNSGLV